MVHDRSGGALPQTAIAPTTSSTTGEVDVLRLTWHDTIRPAYLLSMLRRNLDR